ncbi:MAG TPA: hypothetical protein PLG20_05380 [Candidatus Syntrophosphaera sp.]|nr:hypothetical protein [Candidatus Syntrophosphaera sp.]
MPDPRKDDLVKVVPEGIPAGEGKSGPDENAGADKETRKPVVKTPRNFVPIIMGLALLFLLVPLRAQMEVDLSLGAGWTDNVFQLSEHDFGRFDSGDPALEYIDTTDDLKLSASVNLAYPFRYRWWKFTPSVTGTLSENLSNTEKYRRDAVVRFRTDRHYWNCTLLYGYYPRIYVRSYVDSDGSGQLEPFSYERNLYRADLNIKPFKNATVQLHGRYEQQYYNQYWTEFDGNLLQGGIGLRYSFPVFSVVGSYYYKEFDNTGKNDRDDSYESNVYSGKLSLKPMPLTESKPDGATWYPALGLSYEERFFQSTDAWYGGRVDKINALDAALNFAINERWNLLLDYSHTFRNVETPVAAVRQAREYGENRISAAVKYSF